MSKENKNAKRGFGARIVSALDIPSELEHLVALVTASYVWLDDDPEKAQYYMSLYREGMSALKIYTRRAVDTAFTDATGWA